MTDIKKIRQAVEVLSKITDSEWGKIEKIISKQSECIVEPKEELKEISYDDKVKKVTELLKMVGVPAHIKGYSYAREAILLILDNPEKYISEITRSLYPNVAAKFKTTSSRVERAIRHAIEVAWERGNVEIHEKIFGYTISANIGKPTNSQAIVGFADYVRMYML